MMEWRWAIPHWQRLAYQIPCKGKGGYVSKTWQTGKHVVVSDAAEAAVFDNWLAAEGARALLLRADGIETHEPECFIKKCAWNTFVRLLRVLTFTTPRQAMLRHADCNA